MPTAMVERRWWAPARMVVCVFDLPLVNALRRVGARRFDQLEAASLVVRDRVRMVERASPQPDSLCASLPTTLTT